MTDIIKIFKCLSDKSRLNIVESLINGPKYVEILSESLNLSASTVSFHLKKLEECSLVTSKREQYYTIYTINDNILKESLFDLINSGEKNDLEEAENAYKQKIIDSFFKFGKLINIPVQQKKKRIILEEISKLFKKGRKYTEREVNLIIADINDDFCTIRRDMVAEKILIREEGIGKGKTIYYLNK